MLHSRLNCINDILSKLGIDSEIRWSMYISEAIMIMYYSGHQYDNLDEYDKEQALVRLLYVNVSQACKTTNCSVERGIRHAIEVIQSRNTDYELAKTIFGEHFVYREKISNIKFIQLLEDYLHDSIKQELENDNN